jgi:hypothetical protein
MPSSLFSNATNVQVGKISGLPSLENWEKSTGVHSDVLKAASSEIFQKAANNQDFLVATIGLKDQSPAGSRERDFTDRILQSVEQGIQANLPVAMAELNKFSRKSEFSGRQLQWVEFLAGGTVSEFRYQDCQAFRNDNDSNLESYHDYVQVVFPSYRPSQNGNSDLYIEDNVDAWKALLRECPILRCNINLNMQLNAIRMLHFWKFKFAFQGNTVVLVDNLRSPLHEHGNHNTWRATRFIVALQWFKCTGFLNVFKVFLNKYYQNVPAYSSHWAIELRRNRSYS